MPWPGRASGRDCWLAWLSVACCVEDRSIIASPAESTVAAGRRRSGRWSTSAGCSAFWCCSLGCGREATAIGYLLAMVTVVKMGDTGAYTVGRLIGRHKLAPHLSPGKTIEGAIGGLAFSALWGLAGAAFFLVPLCRRPARPAGPMAGVWLIGRRGRHGGRPGRVAAEARRRDEGFQPWMPGFGGVLDIIDSLLFAAPVAYFLLTFLKSGRGITRRQGLCRL